MARTILAAGLCPAAAERWEAIDRATTAITGDITFAPDRITFGNRRSLPLAPAGKTIVTEVASGRRIEAESFRVTTPMIRC